MIEDNKYRIAWLYAISYCRKYGICINTKKWEPWEKKFILHIYNLQLRREV